MSPRKPEQFEEIREEKKKLILDTALILFANKGYYTTSISMIAREAKISKGLMYNYFKSKEELLATIFQRIMDMIMEMLNPDQDDVITDEEAEGFFDIMFGILTKNPEEWKLFFQLTLQPEVMKLLLDESHDKKIQSSQKLIYDYFLTRDFKDPETAILMFSSVLKGFVLQYAFAPELFTKDMVEKFKEKLKEMFLKKKVPGKKGGKEINDSLGYILL